MKPSLSPQPSSVCPMCKHHLQIITDTNTGETICSRCGMVVLDRIQNVSQPEWRAFSIVRIVNTMTMS